MSEYTLGNWRVTPHPRWQWLVEFYLSDKGFCYLDCCYECDYCGECLGCLRKLVWDWDAQEFRQEHMLCPKSPTGFHECSEEDE